MGQTHVSSLNAGLNSERVGTQESVSDHGGAFLGFRRLAGHDFKSVAGRACQNGATIADSLLPNNRGGIGNLGCYPGPSDLDRAFE
jgi:hypothetical protein